MFSIFLILLVIIIIWGIATYNRLVQLKNQVQNSWSQIDVQLQRRHDLIPNLVECAKGYMSHEAETLEKVIQARSSALHAREALSHKGGPLHASLRELAGAEQGLLQGMHSLFALAENYPDLKANNTMLSLQEELTSTENKVSFSRQVYNDICMSYNTKQEEFPALFFAKSFGHKKVEFFELSEPQAKQAPKVSF